MIEAVLELRVGRLARGLEDPAVDVEQPAVIAAANAALADDPVFERSPAMAAMPVQHADASRPVAEHDEVFAHDPRRAGQVREVAGQRHGVPELAQVLPARRPRTDVGQLRVLRRNRAQEIAGERRVQRLPRPVPHTRVSLAPVPRTHGIDPPASLGVASAHRFASAPRSSGYHERSQAARRADRRRTLAGGAPVRQIRAGVGDRGDAPRRRFAGRPVVPAEESAWLSRRWSCRSAGSRTRRRESTRSSSSIPTGTICRRSRPAPTSTCTPPAGSSASTRCATIPGNGIATSWACSTTPQVRAGRAPCTGTSAPATESRSRARVTTSPSGRRRNATFCSPAASA